MPSLLVDGAVLPILDVSQLGAVLGVEIRGRGEASSLAWEIVVILDAWLEHLRHAPWEILIESTPSRGRSLRNLTVNTFHPIELLPAAWRLGRFDWDPDRDGEREATLGDAAALVAYAEEIGSAWTGFALDHGSELASAQRVLSPRGELAFEDLLASQRWHAAFHYRQVTTFLTTRGVSLEGALRAEALRDLDLPSEVF